MDQKTTVKNVNILDMRKTPKETFDKIGFIKNVNLLFLSPETSSYLPGISSKNLNAVVEVPADVELQTIMSSVTIDASFLSSIPSSKFLMVMGRVVVGPDVTADLINAKLNGLSVMGKLICPESVAGLLQSKAKVLMGETISYPASAVLVTSALTLDDAFLDSLDDGSELVIAGSLRVVDDVTSERIERKIRALHAHGSILCRQEHALVVKAKLVGSRNMTVIPAGHSLVEGALTLDALTLQTLDNERLFCMGDIIISADVDAQALDCSLDKISSLGAVICPIKLKDVLKAKCDMLDNRVVLYEGTLWYVDDDRHLVPDQFGYIEGPMTIVIRAELTIEADVSPESILDRIDKIHNLGEIVCQPEQIPAIEARLGIREGDVSTPKEAKEEAADQGPSIGNANMLVL
ncbi:hypothetical protein ACFLSZ_04450 [Candidatus Bipolaricaulota bacterium]